MTKSLDHLKELIAIETDECIEWRMGRVPYGYGRVFEHGEVDYAHRASLKLAAGDPPPGKPFALHSCDNPPCVNPRHLRWGSAAENARDMAERGRTKPQSGKDNRMAKLTEEQVRWIRSNGLTGVATARELDVSTATVSLIRNRKVWSHVQ